MRNSTATSSSLWCGDTPAFNYVTAKLSGGSLVFTVTKGVSTGSAEDTQDVKEVARRPTIATALRATGPASAGLSGNCRPGYVQRTAEGTCMRQCLKGTECTGKTKCEFIAVKGTDGDHKVHACVAQ